MYKNPGTNLFVEKLALLYESAMIKETTFICQSEDEFYNFNMAWGLFKTLFPMLQDVISIKEERVKLHIYPGKVNDKISNNENESQDLTTENQSNFNRESVFHAADLSQNESNESNYILATIFTVKWKK